MANFLVRQIYVSCSCVAMNNLRELLQNFAQSNSRVGITSGLLYTDQYFFQVIEGPQQMVEALMARVRRDSRHHSIQNVLQEAISDRKFGDWSMGIARLPHMDPILQPLFTSKDGERARVLGAVLLQALKSGSYDH